MRALTAGFISPDELAALVQRQVPHTLLDVRFTLDEGPLPGEYLAGHIPGAIFVDTVRELSGPRAPTVGSYPVPDPAVFASAARSWGVSENSEVIAYSGYTGISAGRLAWLFRWFGHDRVRVLDGGLRAWEQRGYPQITELACASSPGDFQAAPGGIPVAGVADVLELGAEGQLLDVRARRRYRQAEPDPEIDGGHRCGRIPGAVNVPSTSLHARDGRLRSRDEVVALLAAQGVDPRRPVGVYCGGGIASAWAAFALLAVGVDAAFFAESWAEYVADETLPVQVEPANA
ncbi:MAG TPA: sulfurtransferase [Frankiaceae bacterium]|jgi:thiosulfate/3-mercaptopyruvate sulfurtransferase|nr:sulfurtransferase [Trebonia sp.]HEX4430696.1 sulfurtransferase [Frankiaceae bacterium]